MFKQCSRHVSGGIRQTRAVGTAIPSGSAVPQQFSEEPIFVAGTRRNCWNSVGDHTWNAQGVCMSKALNAHLRCVEMLAKKNSQQQLCQLKQLSSSCTTCCPLFHCFNVCIRPVLLSIRPSISMLLGLDPRSSWLSNGGLLCGLLPVPHRR